MAGPDPNLAAAPVLRLLCAGAVVFSLAAALASAHAMGWTYDEPGHLAYARRLLDTGETERVSVLQYNSKTPISVLNVLAGRAARRSFGLREPGWQRFAVRLPNVAWLALLLSTVWLCARRRFGATAACLATTAVALDPNLIANAALATVDLPYATVTLLVWLAAHRTAQHPDPKWGLLLGLALGVAFLTKFTAFLLVPGVFLLPLAVPALRRSLLRRPGRTAAAVALAAAVTLLVIAAGYGFRNVGCQLNDIGWKSPIMLRLWSTFPHLRLPFPADFLTGLDILLVTGSKTWPVVLLGRDHPGGVWYYFLVVWFFKEPVLLLAGQVYGLVQAAVTRLIFAEPLLLFLILNLVLTLGYFSCFVAAQIGIRFVLMCLPAADLIASAALAPAAASPKGRALFAAMALSAIAVNTPYLGNHLAFTSEAVWPKREAFRNLSDSNIDYGQNRDHIEGWLKARGLGHAHLDPVHVLPGENVLRLNHLAGVIHFEQHRWLREHLRPRGHLGHTYLWFTLDADRYEAFLQEARRLSPGPLDARWCAGSEAVQTVSGNAPVRFPDLGRGEALVACVSATERLDLGLHTERGSVAYGPVALELSEHPPVPAGGQAWFRIEPGPVALVVRGAQGHVGRWEARGASARLSWRKVRVLRGSLAPLD